MAWRAALDLEVPLLSDWNGEAASAYGVEREWRGLRAVAERSAFLVDGARVVRFARRYGAEEVPDFDALVMAARSLP